MQQNEQIPPLWVREHWKTKLQLIRCCLLHISVFCNGSSQNGVCITQEICHLVILFHNISTIKDESNKIFFVMLFYERNASKSKICIVIQPLQNPPLCSSSKFCNSVHGEGIVPCFSENYKVCETCSSENVTLIEIQTQLTIFHICNFCYH
jgi:hypothetical protein